MEPGSFFIVGAPRCGTTSLSTYLRDHPQVCFSRPKETHHFVFASAARDPAEARAVYLQRYFPHLTPAHCTIGEGSVTYLYSPEAIDRILALFPEARFVVCVRNPIDVVQSLHLRMVYRLEEDERDFREAWKLQEVRARGERVPATCRDPRVLRYADVGRLGTHLERMWDQVGRERCFVSVFDDLAADPGKVYRNLLGFLGLGDDARSHFPRQRATVHFRSRLVQRLVMKPPSVAMRFLPRTAEHIERSKRRGLLQLRERLRRRNRVKLERPPLDLEMRKLLREAFADEVAQLEDLLGRDLSHWV